MVELEISDQFSKDEPAFRAKFIGLASVEIKKVFFHRFIVRKHKNVWKKIQ
jgi:hypothetical protein